VNAVRSCWLGCLGALLAAVSLAGCASRTAPVGSHTGRGQSVPSDWVVYHDRRQGFAVSFPSGWHRATRPVAPALLDPRERLAIASFPLRRWPDPCVGDRWPGRPANLDLGPGDVFLTVQERGRDAASRWTDFPPRPAHFKFASTVPAAEVGCADRVGAVARIVNFTDARRHFVAILILGPLASGQMRRDAFGVLDSLRFDVGKQPTWNASGQ
jgi:hypothetical protein